MTRKPRIRIVGPKSPGNRYGHGWVVTIVGTGLDWHHDYCCPSLADAHRLTDKLLGRTTACAAD